MTANSKEQVEDSSDDSNTFGGHRPELTARGGRFFFRLSALGLIASGDTVQAAYDALVEHYGALLDEVRAADLADELPPPALRVSPGAPAAGAVVLRADLRGFAIKLVLAVAAVAVIVVPLTWSVSNSVDRLAAKLRGGPAFWTKFERELHRAARPDKGLSPEHQEELLSSLRVVVSRVKPFTDAVAPLFEADAECGCADPPRPERPAR